VWYYAATNGMKSGEAADAFGPQGLMEGGRADGRPGTGNFNGKIYISAAS